MNIKTKLTQTVIFILLSVVSIPISAENNIDKSKKEIYQKSVSIVAKALKNTYEPNEPVTLIVAIANHSSEPIYISRSESDYLRSSCLIKDANGIRIEIGSRDTPPSPPADYYMEKNGKSTFVVPVYKIDGFSLIIAIINDAFTMQHKNNINISDGIYYIDPIIEGVIHEADEIIERKNVSSRFCVEPQSTMIKMRHKSNTVKIEIRKKEE